MHGSGTVRQLPKVILVVSLGCLLTLLIEWDGVPLDSPLVDLPYHLYLIHCTWRKRVIFSYVNEREVSHSSRGGAMARIVECEYVE